MFNEYQEEAQAINKVVYAKRVYEMQKDKVKQEAYIEDVLFDNFVESVKCYKTRYDCLPIYEEAQSQFSKNRKGPQLKMLKDFLLEDFLNNDPNFELTNLTRYGYEGMAWIFEFTGYGLTIRLFIPIKANINKGNILHSHSGKFAFIVEEDKNRWTVVCSDYSIESVSASIQQYFKEKRGNLHDSSGN